MVVTTTDAKGQLTATTVDPAGLALKTRYTYTASGDAASVTDPLGRITKVTYDAARRPVTVTQPLGAVTQYVYDRDGRVIDLKRADPTRPDGWQHTRTTYLATTKKATQTDPDGRVTTYAYDKLDRECQCRLKFPQKLE